MDDRKLGVGRILLLVVSRVLVFFSLIGAMIFGAAGTFDYPGGWFLMGYFLIFATSILLYFLRRDPDFIRRRMNYNERERSQRRIIAFSLPVFVLLFILPPLHWRLGPPVRPWLWIAIGIALTVLGTLFIVGVFLQNRWASRTIVVSEGQKVIDTGFYAFVRHPMYLGVIFLYPGLSLMLGSPWGLVTFPFLVATMVVRIRKEEEFLIRELPDYAEYRGKTRWRLVPHIW